MLHVSIETDHHQTFSTKLKKKQGKNVVNSEVSQTLQNTYYNKIVFSGASSRRRL
jgi:hypothetical protein